MIFSKRISLIDGRKISLTEADTEAIKTNYGSIERFNISLNSNIQTENKNEDLFKREIVQHFENNKSSWDERNYCYKKTLSFISLLDKNKIRIRKEFDKLKNIINKRKSNILEVIKEIIIRIEIHKQKCQDFAKSILEEGGTQEEDHILYLMDFDRVKYKSLEDMKLTDNERKALNRLYGSKLINFERKINVFIYKVQEADENIANLDFAVSIITTQLHALLLKETDFDLKNVGSTIKDLEKLKDNRINELIYKIQEIQGILKFIGEVKNHILKLTNDNKTPLIELLNDMIISAQKSLSNALNLVKGMKQSNN